jgi:kynurenine formamidase
LRTKQLLTEREVLALFETCSNRARWGTDDELGTLNHITPEKRLLALRSVTDGVMVSLGKDLVFEASSQTPPSAVHYMTYAGHDPQAALDVVAVSSHGLEVTHVDAVGHSYFEGRQYNGLMAADNVGPMGIARGSIHAQADGLLTRGVLLDVASVTGVEHLDHGSGISADDLEQAEKLGGVRVTAGDAIFIRSGLDLEDPDSGDPGTRTGVLACVVPWLHERGVAIYSGDCIEKIPSGYSRVPMPLHQVGLVAMGLCMLDNTDLEVLKSACAIHGRNEFAIFVAPLRIPGGTGSAVNPIAVF